MHDGLREWHCDAVVIGERKHIKPEVQARRPDLFRRLGVTAQVWHVRGEHVGGNAQIGIQFFLMVSP